MLTKLILAGLIPGMMAKPIAQRQDGHVDRRQHGGRQYYNVKPQPVSHVAVSSVHSLHPTSVPSVSASFPVPPSTRVVTHTPSISSFPVAPPPALRTGVPAIEYAVAPPPVSHTVIPSFSTEVRVETPVVPVVTPSVAPSYPVKNEYFVKAPPVVTHILPSSVPSSAPSHPVKNEYFVKAPPVVSHVVPSSAPSHPVKNEYFVKSPPVVSHVSHVSHIPVQSHPAAKDEYAVKSPSPVSSVVQQSAAHPAPSHHQYPVAGSPLSSRDSHAVAPSFGSYAVEEPRVHPSVSSIAEEKQPAGPSYAVNGPPAHPSSNHAVVAAAPSVTPSVAAYQVEEAPIHHVSSVSAVIAAPAVTPSVAAYQVQEAPVHTPSVSAVIAAPAVTPSVPAYRVEEPPVHAPSVSAVVAAPYVTPSAAAYPVGEAPVHVSAVSAAVDTPYEASSHPAGPAYAVETPAHPVEPVYSVETPTHAVEPAYAVETPSHPVEPVYSVETPSHPVDAVYAVETPAANYAAPPTIKVDPAGPSGKNECVTKCHGECQRGDKDCMAACLQLCHSAKMISSNGLTGSAAGKLLNKDGAAAADAHEEATPVTSAKTVTANAKAAGKPVAGAAAADPPTLAAGAGFVSYEACMKSCKGKFQEADIAFPISQGKSNCAEACASYASEGSTVSAAKTKRAVEPVAGALRPAAPALTAGAGYASLEECLKDCNGRWQSANIVFDINQGRKHCKTACASYESDGSGVSFKREAVAEEQVNAIPVAKKTVARDFPFEGDGPFNKPAGKDGPFTKTPETVAGASTSSYEACLHGCGVKLQSADIAFEVEQGSTNCATRCAKYSSNGAGVSHV